MLRFAATRLISLSLSLLAASIVIFAVIEVIPGDPASFMLGLNAQPDTVAALREQLGLEGSVLTRYLSWIGGMLTGDFGTSYTYRVPVSELAPREVKKAVAGTGGASKLQVQAMVARILSLETRPGADAADALAAAICRAHAGPLAALPRRRRSAGRRRLTAPTPKTAKTAKPAKPQNPLRRAP